MPKTSERTRRVHDVLKTYDECVQKVFNAPVTNIEGIRSVWVIRNTPELLKFFMHAYFSSLNAHRFKRRTVTYYKRVQRACNEL